MLQTDSLLPWRTIYKNVLFGLEIRKIKTLENEKYAQELLKNTIYMNLKKNIQINYLVA